MPYDAFSAGLGDHRIVTTLCPGGKERMRMLSGGEALENHAVRNASSVLRALARRMPSVAHRKKDFAISDVALDDIAVGDTLVVYPLRRTHRNNVMVPLAPLHEIGNRPLDLARSPPRNGQLSPSLVKPFRYAMSKLSQDENESPAS
jgi:hypothetical protein